MTKPAIVDVTEQKRLNDAREAGIPWKKWGPYLSERQWGTVREDYSDDGNAWAHFSHEQSRSRAYRWGEDGLGGISDDKQRLCFALTLWNGRDPILKERLFGLTNSEGNHGEDVKEYYFYIDSTPTHSYMKYLYKYPQREFPYRDLVETNRMRSREELEYELLDTGAFDEDRYFDVFVEYAKAGPEDILIRITVHNRGPESARLHLLPTLWYRNTWSWGEDDRKPALREAGPGVIEASHHDLGKYTLYSDGTPELLFTENESNAQLLWGQPNASPYVKDAFHTCVTAGNRAVVNPDRVGTKAAAHHVLDVPAGGSQVVRLRLTGVPVKDAFKGFEHIVESRIAEADEFYKRITPPALNDDARRVHRQALAGMLWGKQYYYFDLEKWLDEHRSHPMMDSARPGVRNTEWFHMLNAEVISMPDKWEYPWYAAWDLAFHTISLALVDFDFAKDQLLLMLRGLYFHPNGQIPAYEWNFSDVNPPVHAWATLYLFRMERTLGPSRPALPGAIVPGPDAELQLVGQPEGPDRAQRVRRRLSRARQHRGVRPQRAAADRRLTGAGRRHGLDGLLLPVHARDVAHPLRARLDVRGARLQVRAAFHVDHLRHGPDWRKPRRDVGRGGRLLLRLAATAGWTGDAPEGAVVSRPVAACVPPRCSRGTSSRKRPG